MGVNPQETNPLEDTLQRSRHFVQNRPKLKQPIKRRKGKHIMHIHTEARSTAAMGSCHGEQPRGAVTGSCHREQTQGAATGTFTQREGIQTQSLQMNQTVLGDAVGAGLPVGCQA